MLSRHGLLVMLLCLFSNVAWAEGRCPPGMFDTGATDYLSCAPIPGYNQGNGDSTSAPPRPLKPTVWATRWGAISAEMGGGGGFGAVNGFSSEAAANQAALEQCQATASISKTECKVLRAYHNQCGAYAWGGGRFTASSAVDIPTVEARALKSCSTASGTECKIYYSGCSYAEAVPK